MSQNTLDSKEKISYVLNRYKRKQPEFNLILVPILDNAGKVAGFLHPVTADFASTIFRCVELLDRWRKENPTLSPSRFPISHERTTNWITNSIIENNGRILFMIQNLEGSYIGHIGFTNIIPESRSGEIDMVVRGEKEINPGLMTLAMKSLIRWGKAELGLEHIDLVVLPHNDHGIEFYQRCGFKQDGVVPLIKVENNNEISWIRCKETVPDPEYYFLHMTLGE